MGSHLASMMKNSGIAFAGVALLTCVAPRVHAGPWTPPAAAATTACLPRLDTTPTIDGALEARDAACCIPLRYASCVAIRNREHPWTGPGDAGAEIFCGWTGEGLWIAAEVVDDDVVNRQDQGADFWKEDCLELFVDGRVGDTFMKMPYGPGAYQILVRPPVGDEDARIGLNPRDGGIEGLRVGGVRTSQGYTLEVLIPWTAFPGLDPDNAAVGIQFGLDDYDARDGDTVQPLMLSYRGATNLFNSPQKFIRFGWGAECTDHDAMSLDPGAHWDVPGVVVDSESLSVSVELGGALAATAASVVLETDAGNVTRPFGALPPPWDRSVRASVPWSELAEHTSIEDGYNETRLVVRDEQGRTIGRASRTVLVLSDGMRSVREHLGATDLGTLATDRPFLAAQYLGLAAALERVEGWYVARDLGELAGPYARNRDVTAFMVFSYLEMCERLRLLTGATQAPDPELPRLLQLLALSTRPEAQVVVEYPEPHLGAVTFCWGPVPLVLARVHQKGSPDIAARQTHDKPAWTPTGSGTRDRRAGVVRQASGDWIIEADSGSRKAAEAAVRLIDTGRPVESADVDAMRRAIIEEVGDPEAEGARPDRGLRLHLGDLHMHTLYSDGRLSPVGLALQSQYCFLDFTVITDHNLIEGAQVGRELFSRYGNHHPVIVGEEITMMRAYGSPNELHLNAYPLREVVPWLVPVEDAIAAARAQGAAVHWNHPHALKDPYSDAHWLDGLEETTLHAWEHIPEKYVEWKEAGRQPVIVGTTDTHSGTFAGNAERTWALARAAHGEDIAEAVREGRVVAIMPRHADFFYGPDRMIEIAWAALRDGETLKARKADSLRAALAWTDLAGLVQASESRRIQPEDLPPRDEVPLLLR